MNDLKLSIVIPSYNEEKNLNKGVLNEVEDYLRKKGSNFEVIIVDDGSTDNSVEIIKGYISKNEQFLSNQNKQVLSNRNQNFHLIQNAHGGKANAVMTGMFLAKGEIVLFTDMDQATPISQIEKFLPKFTNGFDIVIGSRQGRKGAPLVRKLSAWGFAVLRTIILGLPFRDTQCGFKAFSKASIDKMLPKIKNEWGIVHFSGGAVNAGFDVELLYLAKKYGFKIAEVPVEWKYVDTERVQIVKDALAAIYDMFRIRWNDLVGKYEG